LINEFLPGLQFLVKSIDLAFNVNQALLLTREKGMAFGANLSSDFLSGRTGGPRIPARARYSGVGIICWVYSLFHYFLLSGFVNSMESTGRAVIYPAFCG
jgi:hypothetical protein